MQAANASTAPTRSCRRYKAAKTGSRKPHSGALRQIKPIPPPRRARSISDKMKVVWWVLSLILVGLLLALMVLVWIGSRPFALQAVSVVLVALWRIALVYFVVRRW